MWTSICRLQLAGQRFDPLLQQLMAKKQLRFCMIYATCFFYCSFLNKSFIYFLWIYSALQVLALSGRRSSLYINFRSVSSWRALNDIEQHGKRSPAYIGYTSQLARSLSADSLSSFLFWLILYCSSFIRVLGNPHSMQKAKGLFINKNWRNRSKRFSW